MKPYVKEDLLLLNIVWAFKAGLISGYRCLDLLEQAKHSFEELQ